MNKSINNYDAQHTDKYANSDQWTRVNAYLYHSFGLNIL